MSGGALPLRFAWFRKTDVPAMYIYLRKQDAHFPPLWSDWLHFSFMWRKINGRTPLAWSTRDGFGAKISAPKTRLLRLKSPSRNGVCPCCSWMVTARGCVCFWASGATRKIKKDKKIKKMEYRLIGEIDPRPNQKNTLIQRVYWC